MKTNSKFLIYCGMASIIIFNVCSVNFSNSKTESNIKSITTAFAQTECPDDERNETGPCYKQCLNGTVATGEVTSCFTGNIDCTPKDCDAICGTIA